MEISADLLVFRRRRFDTCQLQMESMRTPEKQRQGAE
jgi:hypothetical protein